MVRGRSHPLFDRWCEVTTAIDLHQVIDVERTESHLGEHWQVKCRCGFETAYWTNITYSVDEYGRHAIVAAFDHAVESMTQQHRARNRTPNPTTSPVSIMGRFANALRS